jgi:thiamine-monophosphate kinase
MTAPRLCDLGEDALIESLRRLCPGAPDLQVGPGDDCAVIHHRRGPLELLKTDAIVEGVHFAPTANPTAVGWKALARVSSDCAAMGGRPSHAVVTLALKTDQTVSWVEGLYRGLRRCARRVGCSVAGGELVRVPAGSAAVISVAAVGVVGRRELVLRSGGRPGDVVAVTGRLGGSLAGRHLRFEPRLEEAGWLVAAGWRRPRAMMDLSDGLARDLPRLARASGCGYELDLAMVPRRRGCGVAAALGDGEDYELLVAVAPAQWPRVAAAWRRRFPRLPLTAVGRLVAGPAVAVTGGWDHFAVGRQ